MKNAIEQLLDEVFSISRHHKELCALSGESFNIFSVLEVESAEVRTHSRLLTELLDPKGSHGLDDAFLKLFLSQVGIEGFDTKGAKAVVEFYIGPQTETEGGRIDILIAANGKHVIIENKIYAGDQKNQLLRYYNYGKTAPFHRLFYLTLNGDEPTPLSTGTLDRAKYECISYKADMLEWLEACKEKAVNSPLVRETITQYINLIKLLTNQNRSSKMNNEIVESVLKSSDRLSAFLDLRRAWDSVLFKIYKKLELDVKEIAAKHELIPSFDANATKYTGFGFSNSAMKECGIQICFSFQADDNQDLIFGFLYLNHENKHKTPSDLLTKFVERYPQGKQSDYWPCYAYWQEWRNWTDETYKEIYFGDGKLKNAIEEKTEELLAIFASAQKELGVPPQL